MASHNGDTGEIDATRKVDAIKVDTIQVDAIQVDTIKKPGTRRRLSIKWVIAVILLLLTGCVSCIAMLVLERDVGDDVGDDVGGDVGGDLGDVVEGARIEAQLTTTATKRKESPLDVGCKQDCKQPYKQDSQQDKQPHNPVLERLTATAAAFMWRHAARLAAAAALAMALLVLLLVYPRPLIMVAKFVFLAAMSLAEVARMGWSVLRLPMDALAESY